MRHLLFYGLILLCICGCSEKSTDTRKSPAPKTINKKWLGKWERSTWQNEGSLNITSIEGDSLSFTLFASSGGHMGDLNGKAYVKNNKAIFSYADEYDTYLIEFELSGDSLIIINQKEGVCMAGMGVYYSGKFINSKKIKQSIEKELSLLDLKTFQNIREDSAFRSLTGNGYDLFVNSTQLTSEDADIDSLNVRVISSGVRGLFTSMENIIMIDDSLNIWAAVIDDNKVLYFTNKKDYAEKLPKTINSWRQNFENYPVIYKSKE